MSDHAARILVVDDVPENVRLLEAVLRAHGYDVVSAIDGRAALDLAMSAKPDLVLLDVMMHQPDATCGEVGFEDRSDYTAIGVVTNLASRRADEASAGQILITQRLYAKVEDDIEAVSVGDFGLKGFQRPVAAFNAVAVRDEATAGTVAISGNAERRRSVT